ncbi:(Fe-S)-binding protein [Mariprofundus ferrooxydans]|uniref:Iron-sulfur cluster binding protein n=2 Tax=Mariprofundus ferrooxydans TaxID=314344 RepID=Q0F2C2_9PROT|nr:iron-sulfur cluster binding protein [Mariprofundus ferrooxydans PV-1]KON48641.1 (Fe-S)-binding protein [Mariprofundus ferrooxydans]
MCQDSAMNSDCVKSTVQAKALEHGFDLCRVTQPVVAREHAEALHRWVDAGMQGEMDWMAEEVRLQRRSDPTSMLAGVRSVVTVAMRYTPPEYGLNEACSGTRRGVITAYAHGDDYHEVMKKRLKALARDLDTLLGRHDQRVFVDTAPVLEHALAERAGLGWQGKHTLTIHRGVGSWFLLGEIFTTAEIVPDAQAANHCGSCTACIDICPTGAIVAPYVVDARLCISYLTIEFDGFIPHPLRPLMGNRIYGCDDCQMICPWNEHAGKGTTLGDDLLTPRGENHLPDLVSILQLDEDAFRHRFMKSPIRRTKRRGLLRNVCIAMGNSGHAGFMPDLIAVLDDVEPLIRGHAVWALGQLVGQENRADILAVLVQMNVAEKDDAVREEISLTMRHIRMNDE